MQSRLHCVIVACGKPVMSHSATHRWCGRVASSMRACIWSPGTRPARPMHAEGRRCPGWRQPRRTARRRGCQPSYPAGAAGRRWGPAPAKDNAHRISLIVYFTSFRGSIVSQSISALAVRPPLTAMRGFIAGWLSIDLRGTATSSWIAARCDVETRQLLHRFDRSIASGQDDTVVTVEPQYR